MAKKSPAPVVATPHEGSGSEAALWKCLLHEALHIAPHERTGENQQAEGEQHGQKGVDVACQAGDCRLSFRDIRGVLGRSHANGSNEAQEGDPIRTEGVHCVCVCVCVCLLTRRDKALHHLPNENRRACCDPQQEQTPKSDDYT